MAEVEDAMGYYRALHRHVGRSLARHLPASARVLDAGCGTGGLLRRFHAAQPAWSLTGGEIVQGSIAALPFADGTFAAVTSGDERMLSFARHGFELRAVPAN